MVRKRTLRAFVMIAVICPLLAVLTASAYADTYFIICNPKSYVVVRRSPNRQSDEAGRLDCGDGFESDDKRKNGFVHVCGFGEYGDGWVYAGYVVADKPTVERRTAVVEATGRVKAWRYIGRKGNGWLKVGTTVEVYAQSDEWAVTNRGYVRTKYLEVDGD